MEETNEVSKSNKIKIIVITALIFLVSIAGISYAYFTIQITGNDTASSMRLRTANMSLVYNDVQIVSGEYAEPGWTQTKTLTVTNNGNVDARYNIVWRDLYNEVTNNELVISATCSSTSGTCPAISETVVPTETTLAHNIRVKSNIEIPVGVTHTYTLTALFKETGSNQNYNQDKEFYGTLNIAEGSAPATLSLQTDTGTTGLSTGDTVRATQTGIDNQDFYVVSTDASETVLLAKYNLLVGDVFDVDAEYNYTLNKTMNSNNTVGYGLQSSSAKGFVDGDTQYIGVAPFSGTNYWHDYNASSVSNDNDKYNSNTLEYIPKKFKMNIQEVTSGGPVGPTGDIYSRYGTYENGANNIYDVAYSTTAPSINYEDFIANENDYSIAYYVEEYINTLGINGTGRLLTFEEAVNLGCNSGGNCASTDIYEIGVTGTAPTWVYSSTYWLGSADDDSYVWIVDSVGELYDSSSFDTVNYIGVRPVIVVSTSDIGA